MNILSYLLPVKLNVVFKLRQPVIFHHPSINQSIFNFKRKSTETNCSQCDDGESSIEMVSAPISWRTLAAVGLGCLIKPIRLTVVEQHPKGESENIFSIEGILQRRSSLFSQWNKLSTSDRTDAPAATLTSRGAAIIVFFKRTSASLAGRHIVVVPHRTQICPSLQAYTFITWQNGFMRSHDHVISWASDFWVRI